MSKNMTPDQIRIAKNLHADGWAYRAIGEELGFGRDSIRYILDPEYAAMRRKQVNEARRRRGYTSTARADSGNRYPAGKINIETIAARLAEIPADTRNLTARIFGDPLPGRSALDRQHERRGR